MDDRYANFQGPIDPARLAEFLAGKRQQYQQYYTGQTNKVPQGALPALPQNVPVNGMLQQQPQSIQRGMSGWNPQGAMRGEHKRDGGAMSTKGEMSHVAPGIAQQRQNQRR